MQTPKIEGSSSHKRAKKDKDTGMSIESILQRDRETESILALHVFTLDKPAEEGAVQGSAFASSLASSVVYIHDGSVVKSAVKTAGTAKSTDSAVSADGMQSTLFSHVHECLEREDIDCAIVYNIDRKALAMSPYHWQKEMPVCVMPRYIESVKRISEYSLIEMVREYKIDVSCMFPAFYAPAVKKIQESEVDVYSAISMQDSSLIDVVVVHSMQMYALFRKGQLMELAYMLSKITGCSLTDVFGGNKSDRVEALLLRRMRDTGYMLPKRKRSEERDPTSTYEGGYVFLDHPGVYSSTYIALFDFNSLYPSIIQEYNVCFSTADMLSADSTAEVGTAADAFLPETVRALVEQRRRVKDKIKKATPEEIAVLNVEQNAIKLVANCIYGCLGYQGFRFYNKKMAAFITERGRAILQDTKHTFEQMGYRVIYGDTDSVMVDTGISSTDPPPSPEHLLSMSTQVTKKYKNIYLEFEKVFRKIVMIAKKKYFGLYCTVNGEAIEEKGLETGRRDWADVGQKVSSHVLRSLLYHDQPEEEIIQYLASVRQEIEWMPRDSFVIRKKIAKNISEYSQGQQQSLQQVALAVRMQQEGKYVYKAGDIVSFVIATYNGTSRPELVTETSPIDIAYYVQMQILAPVQRMIEHFPSVSLAAVKKALGIAHSVHSVHSVPYSASTTTALSHSPEDKTAANAHRIQGVAAKEHEKYAMMSTPCCNVVQVLNTTCTSCGQEITHDVVLSAIKTVVYKRMCAYYKIDRKCPVCKGPPYSISPVCLLCLGPLEDVVLPSFECMHSFLSYVKMLFEDTEYSSTVDDLVCYISKVPVDLCALAINAQLSMLYTPALYGRIDLLDKLLR